MVPVPSFGIVLQIMIHQLTFLVANPATSVTTTIHASSPRIQREAVGVSLPGQNQMTLMSPTKANNLSVHVKSSHTKLGMYPSMTTTRYAIAGNKHRLQMNKYKPEASQNNRNMTNINVMLNYTSGLVENEFDQLNMTEHRIFPELFHALLQAGKLQDSHTFSYQCRQDLAMFSLAWSRKETWSWSMYDSMGKPRPGLFSGTMTWSGNLEQCLNTHVTYSKPSHDRPMAGIRTRFCAVYMTLPKWLTERIRSFNIPFPVAAPSVIADICTLSGCSEHDLHGLFQKYVEENSRPDNITVTKVRCLTEKKVLEDAPAVVSLCVIFLLILLALAGTLFELILRARRSGVRSSLNILVGSNSARNPILTGCGDLNMSTLSSNGNRVMDTHVSNSDANPVEAAIPETRDECPNLDPAVSCSDMEGSLHSSSGVRTGVTDEQDGSNISFYSMKSVTPVHPDISDAQSINNAVTCSDVDALSDSSSDARTGVIDEQDGSHISFYSTESVTHDDPVTANEQSVNSAITCSDMEAVSCSGMEALSDPLSDDRPGVTGNQDGRNISFSETRDANCTKSMIHGGSVMADNQNVNNMICSDMYASPDSSSEVHADVSEEQYGSDISVSQSQDAASTKSVTDDDPVTADEESVINARMCSDIEAASDSLSYDRAGVTDQQDGSDMSFSEIQDADSTKSIILDDSVNVDEQSVNNAANCSDMGALTDSSSDVCAGVNEEQDGSDISTAQTRDAASMKSVTHDDSEVADEQSMNKASGPSNMTTRSHEMSGKNNTTNSLPRAPVSSDSTNKHTGRALKTSAKSVFYNASTFRKKTLPRMRKRHLQTQLSAADTGKTSVNTATLLQRLLVACSIRRNTTNIFGKGHEDMLFCLNGIRVLSNSWIVLGSYFMTIFSNPAVVENHVTFSKFGQSFWVQFLINTGLAADTFFIMSGALNMYNLMKAKATSRCKSMLRVMTPAEHCRSLIHRLFRIVPCHYMSLMIHTNLSGYLGTGRELRQQTEYSEHCRNHWWSNVLFVSNFHKAHEMCMPWSYYLVNDLQMSLLSPLVTIPLLCRPVLGFGLISCLVVLQIVLVLAINTPINGNSMRTNTSSYFSDVQVKPYCRAGVYAIGLGLGYFLYSGDKKVRLTKVPLCAGWLLCLTAVLSLPQVTYLQYQEGGRLWSGFETSLYEALSRPLWGLAVAWIIFTCCNGQGGLISKILSWNVFIPLARITYAVYVLHPILMEAVLVSHDSNIKVSIEHMILGYISLLAGSWCLAICMILLVEQPFVHMETVIRHHIGSKKNPVTSLITSMAGTSQPGSSDTLSPQTTTRF